MGEIPPYTRSLRYRSVTSTSSDPRLDHFIDEVKKYPCLYNTNSLQYRDQYMKEECWNIISRTMHSSRGNLKKEWKRLRDGYRQALVTRISAKKKVLKPWKYEEQMDFLKPYICPKSRLLVAAGSPSSDNDMDYFPIKEEEGISDDDSSQQSISEQPSNVSELLIRSALMNIKPDPDAHFTPKVNGKKRKKKAKFCFMLRKRPASACASRPEDIGGEGSSPTAGNGGTPSIANCHGDNGNMPSTSNSGNNGFSPEETRTQPGTSCSINNDNGNSSNNLGDGGNASSVIESDMMDIMTTETISNRNIMDIDKVIGPSHNNPDSNATAPSTSNNGSILSISNVRNNDSTSSTSNADNNGRISPASSYVNNGTPLTSDGENNDPTPSTSSPRNNGSVPSTSNAGNNSSTPLNNNNGGTPPNSNAGNNGVSSSRRTSSTRRNGMALLLSNPRNNRRTRSSRNAGNTSSSSNNRVSTSSNRAGRNHASRRSATNDLSIEDSYVIFVDHDPNDQEHNVQNIEELRSTSRCRTYHIQEFHPDPHPVTGGGGGNPINRVATMRDATPSNLRSCDQVYRAIQQPAGILDFSLRNNDQQLSAMQLFLASIYQTVKQMPLKYQNNIKINMLEYLKVAEEEFEQVQAQQGNNASNSVPRQSQNNQENRATLQSANRFFGDNDPRHGALQLYLASIHESLKKMPRYLLSYMKINIQELVSNVEEMYKNDD